MFELSTRINLKTYFVPLFEMFNIKKSCYDWNKNDLEILKIKELHLSMNMVNVGWNEFLMMNFYYKRHQTYKFIIHPLWLLIIYIVVLMIQKFSVSYSFFVFSRKTSWNLDLKVTWIYDLRYLTEVRRLRFWGKL